MRRTPTVVTRAHRAPMTEDSMPAIRKWRLTTHALRLLITTLLLALLGALLLAGTALATAKPGKPTAKSPTGTVTTTTPTFKWGKAARATRYELRVYQSSTRLLKKTGIIKLSWKAVAALPTNVALTWKVRAINSRGAGAWSKSLAFTIVPLSPAKAITGFSFQGLAPPVVGTITEASHTIALTVPHGTNVSALVPTITITGASVSPASGAARDFTDPLIYTVTAADASTQDYVVTVTVAAEWEKAITGFSFQGLAPPVIGVINEAAHTIALTVPFGTNLNGLVATFATTGASVKVGATPQVSGTTANSFTSPVTYTVTAADASTQDYVVTVTVAPSPAKAITAFSFQGLAPPVIGVINEAAHTIALTVPFGTNLNGLVATFATTGASVKVGATPQVSGTTANSFTSPVTYTVTAADASTQDYVVTVTVAPSPAKAITAFSFQGLAPPVIGVINEAAHTIALTVPFGTNLNGLVATFATTGASVKVGATPQTSGITPRDFSSPVTYTVTAADASTQDYTVTVTVAAAVIGQSYGGGKITYILQPGDPGYLAGQTHGLIASTFDQTEPDPYGINWATQPYWRTPVPGGTSTAIGAGSANTDAIIAQNGAGTTYAAGLARAYNGGGYSDWFLPSKDELNKLYLNRVAIGGFHTSSWPHYWSSSEYQGDLDGAWLQSFDDGEWNASGDKGGALRVRAVRAF